MGALFFLSVIAGYGPVTHVQDWPLSVAVALVAGLGSAYATWKQQEKSFTEQHAKDGK